MTLPHPWAAAALIAGAMALLPDVATTQVATARSGVFGTVVDPDGRPVPDALVELVGGINRYYKGSSDADGEFRIGFMMPGSYTLTATRSGFARTHGHPTEPSSYEPRAPFRLGQDEFLTGVTIRLLHGGVIAGRVLDDYDRPVPDVPITALDRDGDWAVLEMSSRSSRTNVDGEYRLRGLTPGDYWLRASPVWTPYDARLGSSRGPRVAIAGMFYPDAFSQTAGAMIRIGANEERAGVDLRLRIVPLFRVSGRIAGPMRQGREVSLVVDPGGRVVSFVTADPDGRFVLDDVPPGAYWVILDTRIGDESRPAREPRLRAARRLDVRAGDVSDIVLSPEPLGIVSGRVVLSTEAARLIPDPSSLEIDLERLDGAPRSGRERATANKDGNFTLTDVASGRYRIRAFPSAAAARLDSSLYWTRVDVTSSATTTGVLVGNELEIPPGGLISNLTIQVTARRY